MVSRQKFKEKFKEHGFDDFRWLDPQKIVVAQWVRLKCMFGCNEYGQTATCPPNVPSLSECARFFGEYKTAVIFHFQKKVKKPEDRFVWTRKMNLRLLELEREVFLSGHQKAFLLFLDSCNICAECTAKKEACRKPKMSRPTPEAMGVDVFTTVRRVGYPIEILSRYEEEMNRYAFLLIE